MAKTRIALAAFKNHLYYRKWVYLTIAVAGLLVCDLAYTITEYRPPNERKVEFQLVQGSYVDTEALAQIAQQALRDVKAADPTLEAVDFISMTYAGDASADMYGAQKYVVTIAAREGAVWIVPKVLFQQLHAQGALLSLDTYVEAGLLDTGRTDLTGFVLPEASGETDEEGIPKTPDGPPHLYGLPASMMPGLAGYGYPPSDACIVVMRYCVNPETSVRVLRAVMDQLNQEEKV